jgi:translocation and assembly module TamA
MAVAVMLLAVVPAATPARAADHPEKKALVQGIENRTLRDELERAIGESLNPAQSRIEARRRAQAAQGLRYKMRRSCGGSESGKVAIFRLLTYYYYY